jgi:hypothetical protein
MRWSTFAAALGAACAMSVLGGCGTPEQKAQRAQARATRADFVKKNEYDHVNNRWVAKGSGPRTDEPPPSLTSRDAVQAEMIDFMSKNRWDNVYAVWLPIAELPRSTMSRDEMRHEFEQFLRTHTYDEIQGGWVPKQ